MPSVTTATVLDQIDINTPSRKVEKKAGKRIGYNYIIIKSLKESQKNDVVLCLYIKSLINFGFCVIKEGSYGDTKDKHGRDIIDRLLWQKQLHQMLSGRVRLPRLLGSFEENGNYYLVLQRIRGKPLSKICKEQGDHLRQALIDGSKPGIDLLYYMEEVIKILEDLHKNKIVHRDVTAANFIVTPSKNVAVIDMELSYSLQQELPAPPFQLGTYGYMSPEQEITETPTVEQDTFSVAAIVLYLWTGISPNKLIGAPLEELIQKVRFFIPDAAFSDTIVSALNPDPKRRPALPVMREVITSYKHDLANRRRRPTAGPVTFGKDEILDTVRQAISTLSSPLMADKERGWFSANGQSQQNAEKNGIDKAWYTSFFKGACGVMYFLCMAKTSGLDIALTRPHIESGISLVKAKYIDRITEVKPGLHFGSSGIAAVLAIAMQHRLLEEETRYSDWINSLLDIENELPGFHDGISGQGTAGLISRPFLCATSLQVSLTKYVNILLNRQEKDGSWIRLTEDRKRRATRGFAHGVAGIAHFLLQFAAEYNSKDALTGAQRGLQWLMRKSTHHKNGIQWKSSSGKSIPSWWCDGAAGISLTFLKAYELSGDVKYKEYAIGALSNQSKEVISNNLSQYNGLSGLGEIYMEAFRILQDDEWLDRATWVTQVLMHIKKRNTTYGPYWLVDHERQPVAGFMDGNSGVLHYLLRYCCPAEIGFPLLSQCSLTRQI